MFLGGVEKMINKNLLNSRLILCGHTQMTLAKILKISRTALSFKFNGKFQFNLREIATIQDLLKLTDSEVIAIFIEPNKGA